MINQKDKIIEVLRHLSYRFSPEYLLVNYERVYMYLLKITKVNEDDCASIKKVLSKALNETDWTNFSCSTLHDALIHKCNFDEKTADELVDIMTCVYTDDILNFWKERNYPGLLRFVRQIIGIEWKGFAVKRKGYKNIEYSYCAHICLLPLRNSTDNNDLLKILKTDPNMDKKAIQMFFAEKLSDFLDEAFELYFSLNIKDVCADDFPIELYLNLWCDNYGFEIDEYEGHGDTV